MDQLSESYTKLLRSAINLKIAIIIRFCMTDELNGQALPAHHTNPYKNYNFQNDGTSRYFGLWLWKLMHLLDFVCSSSGVFSLCVWSNCSRAAVPWQTSMWLPRVVSTPVSFNVRIMKWPRNNLGSPATKEKKKNLNKQANNQSTCTHIWTHLQQQ